MKKIGPALSYCYFVLNFTNQFRSFERGIERILCNYLSQLSPTDVVLSTFQSAFEAAGFPSSH